jgi:glycosyltransferase involved in cell wall biosynthesis
MLKRAGRLRPVVVCARLGGAGSGFYRHLLEKAGVEIIDLYKLDVAAAADTGNQKLLDLCRSDDTKRADEFLEDPLRYLIIFLKIRPKIVHAFLDENNVKAGVAAVLARVPKIVLSARSVAPDNFKWLIKNYMRPGYKSLLRRHEVVFCSNSYAGGRDYRRWLLKPFLKIHVVHNGVDFEAFATRDEIDRSARARFGIPSQALVIVSVMRLSEEKQPVLWARAVIEISRRRPNVHFVLVGDGPSRSEVELMIEQASIAGRVCIIPQTLDVPTVLRASDLFLLTSRVEGLPNVLIEAQAVGVPVVTTPAGGAVETLNPGVTGLIAPDYSVSALVDTCLSLLDNDALRASMAKAAPLFVRGKFSLDRMFRDTLSAYDA